MQCAAIATVALRRVAIHTTKKAVVPGAVVARLPVGRRAWESTIVRHFHFSRAVSAAAGQAFLDKADTAARIVAVVKNFEKVDSSLVTETARFKEDLSLDSLDAVEVVMAIEDEFTVEIPDAEADKILSVEDAVNYVVAHPMAK
ncbi:unnamed protein product [Choristocarpus tenellus]